MFNATLTLLQTLVFAATRHHVEYIHLLLDLAGISNTYIYSQLDSTARKIHAAKFANKKASVLVVTDLAARGIDIPLLDNVVSKAYSISVKGLEGNSSFLFFLFATKKIKQISYSNFLFNC